MHACNNLQGTEATKFTTHKKHASKTMRDRSTSGRKGKARSREVDERKESAETCKQHSYDTGQRAQTNPRSPVLLTFKMFSL